MLTSFIQQFSEQLDDDLTPDQAEILLLLAGFNFTFSLVKDIQRIASTLKDSDH